MDIALEQHMVLKLLECHTTSPKKEIYHLAVPDLHANRVVYLVH